MNNWIFVRLRNLIFCVKQLTKKQLARHPGDYV